MLSNEIKKSIMQMSRDELKDLFDFYKMRRFELRRIVTAQLKIGQRMQFGKGRGRQIKVPGVITKINTTTVEFKADDGIHWKVAASLLESIGV